MQPSGVVPPTAEPPSAKRVKLVGRLILLWVALILVRLFKLQVLDHDYYHELAQQQQERTVEILAPRGTIFDRTGQALAISVPVDSVCVNPMRIVDPTAASALLASILKLNAEDLSWKIKVAQARHRGFLWVKRKVTQEQADLLRNKIQQAAKVKKGPKLDWIEFRMESKRIYALDGLGAHVIGSVDFEENGNSGVEQSLNDELQGRPGSVHMVVDVKQRGRNSRVDSAPSPGKPIQLTIHGRLQYIAEAELKKAVLAHHCKSGSIVAMNPKTGEILAMANFPAFDPNQPPSAGEGVGARSDLAVTTPFEPGSVFKVITIAAALETTRLRPQSVVSCGNGHLTLFGREIHDHNSYASLSMEDVLARSSNIGAIRIGLEVGDKNMFDYVHRFGFGVRTGVLLPGESGGLVRSLKRWQKSSIGSVAMGHEVSVTALQLARACSVIANGGYLVKPKLMMDGARLVNAGTNPVDADDFVRVIRPETANTMRQMMRGVVDKPWGTGFKYAHIPGYSSGGKTGPAQIFDQKSHTYTHLYNASFMGFAPVNDPAIVVVVTINGASGLAGYGGPASAPVFREVAAAALRLLNIPKDLPDSPMPNPSLSEADENDLALAELASSDPQPLTGEDDPALPSQRPFLTGPATPNFSGMSRKEAVQKSAEAGLPIEFVGKGTGLVRSQNPLPGTVLPVATRIRVQLGL